MPTFELSTAPKAVQDLYWQHFEEMREQGKSETDARQYAYRMIHLAGWYQHGKDWKRLTEDTREKVNVREAFKQPNGRYVIFDVDVFYPNAVKGGDTAYTAEQLDFARENTNRIINSGGWKPPLIEGHNPAGDLVSDSQADGHGFGVNWRESPRGPGWQQCDLIDVEPEYVERMKERKLTGFSARMAKDAGKLGLRFGHVAILGGTPPALPFLPVMEVYSNSSSLNQVCFSAEADTFSGVPLMERESAKKMAECYSALGAAYNSFAAGEPGAEAKLHEAHSTHLGNLSKHLSSHKDEFAGYVGESQTPKDPLSEAGMGGDYATTESGVETGGSKETELAEQPEHALQASKAAPCDLSSIDFSDANSIRTAFEAMQNNYQASIGQQTALVAKLGKMTQLLEKVEAKNSALTGKLAQNDFHATCDELRNKHQLPDQAVLDEQWQNCFASADPKKALLSLKKLIQSFPLKPETPADFNNGQPIFGTDGARKMPSRGAQDTKKETQEEALRELYDLTGHNFTAQDIQFGDAFADAIEAAMR